MKVELAVEEVCRAIPHLFQRFYRRLPVGAYQPTPEALAILNHLAQSGPLTVSEGMRHFRRSQSAMSEIVTRLETRGLVERMPDERDRRRILFWLTSRGREVLAESAQILSPPLLSEALEQMDIEQRQALIDGLQALLATRPQPKESRGD